MTFCPGVSAAVCGASERAAAQSGCGAAAEGDDTVVNSEVGQTMGVTLVTPTGSLPGGTMTSKNTVRVAASGTTLMTARSGTWKRWIRALPESVVTSLPTGSREMSSAMLLGNPLRSPAAFSSKRNVTAGVARSKLALKTARRWFSESTTKTRATWCVPCASVSR